MTQQTYDTLRLSKHFVLLDFMYDRDAYTFGQPLHLEDIWSAEHEQFGVALCNKLLEPLIEEYGPCSVAGGFWPDVIQTPGGHYHTTPHFWNRRCGAGADVVWHDWVNQNKAPINMAFDLERREIAKFDRIISYAGSEFLCMATKGVDKMRAALHENRRTGIGTHRYISHSPRSRYTAYRQGDDLGPSDPWRRQQGEAVHSTARSVRPHHVRVGEYFTLLDMGHNARAIYDGVNTVPSVADQDAIQASRMMAEVLDPLVRELGRVSITRGIEPANYARDDEHAWVKQLTHLAPMTIDFLLPHGADDERAMDILEEHPSVVYVESFEHASQSFELSLTIEPFDVETHWTSSTGVRA